jgi:hypothetical protein
VIAVPTVLAWPLKRLAIATLKMIADGTTPAPVGAELLVSTAARPVQVAAVPPAEPERILVLGAPLRSAFREVTAESTGVLTETVTLELVVSVLELGEDVDETSKALGDMCQAVIAAITATTLTTLGRVWLTAVAEDAVRFSPGPEPSVLAVASVAFTAEVVANA